MEKPILDWLSPLKDQIENCVGICNRELRRRKAFTGERLIGLAPNSDVIVRYLQDTFEGRFSKAAIEALLCSPAVKTVILPEVFLELQRHAEYVAWKPFYREMDRPDRHESSEKILSDLKRRVSLQYSQLSNASTVLQRLNLFLSSRAVRDDSWTDLTKNGLSSSEEDNTAILKALECQHAVQPWDQLRRLRNDYLNSMKLSSILAASRNGIHCGFVTDSPRIHRGFNFFSGQRRLDSQELVIDSFFAVVAISLANSDEAEVEKLARVSSALVENMRHCRMDHGLHEFAQDGLEHFLELAFELAQVSSLLHRSWTPPIAGLPAELDLKQVAEAALTRSEELTRLLQESARLFRRPGLVLQQEYPNVLSEPINQLSLNQSFLREIVSSDSPVVIERLIVHLEKGAHMTQYNITQTGSNLTAIVDSFKSSLTSDQSISVEVDKNLKALLDGVVSSKLPDDAKRQVVEATQSVVEDVKKNGHLSGTGQLLWNGLREAIKTVPTAVTAWEALRKLWS